MEAPCRNARIDDPGTARRGGGRKGEGGDGAYGVTPALIVGEDQNDVGKLGRGGDASNDEGEGAAQHDRRVMYYPGQNSEGGVAVGEFRSESVLRLKNRSGKFFCAPP